MLINWLVIVNIVGSIVFYLDKRLATKCQSRVSELTLHSLELLGGVLGIIILMYVIRHKNRKFTYYSVSWIILAGWIVLGLKIFRLL